MKIAVVHEWWAKFGGSESVAAEIASLFSERDLWALYCDQNVDKSLISNLNIHQSWLTKVPKHENRQIAAALAPFAFRTLSTRKYDLVISSSHTFAHTVKFPNSARATYLSYIHSPARVIWSPEIDSRASLRLNLLRGPLQVLDMSMGKHVEGIAANSTEVASRVEKYWGKSSTVIYPPVDIELSNLTSYDGQISPYPFKEFLVSAGRFVEYKNHDFAIDVAASLNMPLVVMGSGPLETSLREKAMQVGANVHFEIQPDRTRWKFLLNGALAMIFPVHEDFGMTPIEAIACGTPVYALGKGGALDYIVDGVNGWLIPNLIVDEFANAILNHSAPPMEQLKASVSKFSIEQFRKNFSTWVSQFHDVS